jgi:hypothetical protein
LREFVDDRSGIHRGLAPAGKSTNGKFAVNLARFNRESTDDFRLPTTSDVYG